MDHNEQTDCNKFYTVHGKKRAQGTLITVKGQRALGYFEKDKIVGYTLLEELNRESFLRDLPEVSVDF